MYKPPTAETPARDDGRTITNMATLTAWMGRPTLDCLNIDLALRYGSVYFHGHIVPRLQVYRVLKPVGKGTDMAPCGVDVMAFSHGGVAAEVSLTFPFRPVQFFAALRSALGDTGGE